MGKLWEVAVLCVVGCLAAKLVLDTVAPVVPGLIGFLIIATILGSMYHKKRRW